MQQQGNIFTKDHLWYYPPPEAFEKIVEYANRYGSEDGKPYFSLDGQKPITGRGWAKLRSKFYCENGITTFGESQLFEEMNV